MRVTRKGYYTIEGPDGLLLRPDGKVRQVTNRDECYEYCVQSGPGIYTIKCPDREVKVPLVIGGPYQGGYFGGTSLSIGASGNLTDAVVSIDAIPNLTIEISETIDMSQYINDPGTLRTATAITGLAGFASYDSGTELLTGVSEGIETGLRLEVTY